MTFDFYLPNLPGKATHFRPHLGPGGCTACGIQAGHVLSVREASSKVNCKRCRKSKAFKKAYAANPCHISRQADRGEGRER